MIINGKWKQFDYFPENYRYNYNLNGVSIVLVMHPDKIVMIVVEDNQDIRVILPRNPEQQQKKV